MEWSSARDDAAVIGVELGLLADDAPSAYLEGPAGAEPSPEEIAAFSASSQLRGYLLGHVRVTQDGSACEGRVEPIENFIDDGARLVFDCPAEVEVVEVEVTLLTPIDVTYRSFGVSRDDATPDVAVFTADTPAHSWDFSAGGEPAADALPFAPMVLGALAAAGAVGGGLWGLRRR